LAAASLGTSAFAQHDHSGRAAVGAMRGGHFAGERFGGRRDRDDWGRHGEWGFGFGVYPSPFIYGDDWGYYGDDGYDSCDPYYDIDC
jgi:hypothetical protein